MKLKIQADVPPLMTSRSDITYYCQNLKICTRIGRYKLHICFYFNEMHQLLKNCQISFSHDRTLVVMQQGANTKDIIRYLLPVIIGVSRGGVQMS